MRRKIESNSLKGFIPHPIAERTREKTGRRRGRRGRRCMIERMLPLPLPCCGLKQEFKESIFIDTKDQE